MQSDRCWTCRKRPRYRQYSVCLSCAVASGFVPCQSCGEHFRPTGLDDPRKPRCMTCRRAALDGSKRSRSVGIVARAGRLIGVGRSAELEHESGASGARRAAG